MANNNVLSEQQYRSLQKKIEEIFEGVTQKFEERIEEKYSVLQLENYCVSLMQAIYNNNPCYPDIGLFHFYMERLRCRESVERIILQLRQCFEWAHPELLFEHPQIHLDEQKLEHIEFAYEHPAASGVPIDMLWEERHISPMAISHYQRYYRTNIRVRETFHDVLSKLYAISERVCEKYCMKLMDDFTCQDARFSIIYSIPALRPFYDYLIVHKMIDANVDEFKDFQALFDNSTITPSKKITWMDKGQKNHMINYLSLFSFFQAMGYTDANLKQMLCMYFCKPDGEAIVESQFKNRKPSKANNQLLQDIRAIRASILQNQKVSP